MDSDCFILSPMASVKFFFANSSSLAWAAIAASVPTIELNKGVAFDYLWSLNNTDIPEL